MIDIVSGPDRDLKNIRQMGTPAEGDKVYIENAAYARIHEEDYEEKRVFIFMGHTECENGIYTIFVEAAIPVRDMEFSQNIPQWCTHAWSDVFREIKRSYENSIIVGWAYDCKGFPPHLSAELEAVHREQFGGAHQILFLMNSIEDEECVFINKGNRMQQKPGFYIYYAREVREILTPEVMVEMPQRGCLKVLPGPERHNKKQDTGDKVENQSFLAKGMSNRNNYQTVQLSKTEQQKMVPDENMQKNAGTGHRATSYAMAAAIALLLTLVGAGIWQNRISIPGFNQAVETISQKLKNSRQDAEVLIGSQFPEETEGTETQSSTETLSEPLDLIPVEEIPAGEIKKIKETEQTESSADVKTKQDTESVETKDDQQKNKTKNSTESSEKEESQDEETIKTSEYYVVKEGDTLTGICQKIYGSTSKVKKLTEINHMDDGDHIRVGQKLLLP